jgi:hypothetical protein
MDLFSEFNINGKKKKMYIILVPNDSSKGKPKLKLMAAASKLFVAFRKRENLSNGICNIDKTAN